MYFGTPQTPKKCLVHVVTSTYTDRTMQKGKIISDAFHFDNKWYFLNYKRVCLVLFLVTKKKPNDNKRLEENADYLSMRSAPLWMK